MIRPPRRGLSTQLGYGSAEEAVVEITRSRRRDNAGLMALVGLGVAALVAVPLAGSSHSVVFMTITGSSQLVFAVLALGFALRTAVLSDLPPQVRRAWRMMLTSYALWPLTIILPTPPSSVLAPEATAGLTTFGARMPRSIIAIHKLQCSAVTAHKKMC